MIVYIVEVKPDDSDYEYLWAYGYKPTRKEICQRLMDHEIKYGLYEDDWDLDTYLGNTYINIEATEVVEINNAE